MDKELESTLIGSKCLIFRIFMMMVFDFYVGCEIRGLKLNMEYLIPSSGIVFFFVNYFILIQTDTYYSDERTFDQLARKEKTIGSVIFCVSVIAVIFSFFYLARQGRTQTVINFYERSFQIRKGMTVAEVEETMNKKIIERDRNHLVTTYSLEAELIELCRIEIVIDNNSQTVKRVEYKKCR